MHKKEVKKSMEHQHHTTHHKSIEQSLVENMVSLQKIHADMAEKFDKLSNQISGLIALFEVSAKSIANSPRINASEKDKDFLDKIDKLLDQNKLLAKGLTMVEGKMREKIYGEAPRLESQGLPQNGMPQGEEQTFEDSQPMTPSIKAPEVPRPLPKY
jgi:hypothetical protein